MATRTEQKAFPTAFGAGYNTLGGSGGAMCVVNSLLDTNTGSYNASTNTYTGTFRYCLTRPVPRTIFFAVSGVITIIQSPFVPIIQGSSYNNLSIMGQTSPEGGITIEVNEELMFQNVDSIIIRYLRVRSRSSTQDALWLLNCTNVITDHLSVSYGGDEALSISGSTGTSGNVTISRCFFQESKTGTILGVDNVEGDFTYAYNLCANISHRFPNPKGAGRYDIFNNSIYNWKERTVRITNNPQCNIVNNYHYAGQNGLHAPGWFGVGGNITSRTYKLQYKVDKNPLIYCAGNVFYPSFRTNPQTNDWLLWQIFAGSDTTYQGSPIAEGDPVPTEFQTLTPFSYVGLTIPIVPATSAHNDIVQNVGCRYRINALGQRVDNTDTVDQNYLDKVINDTETEFYTARNNYTYSTITSNTIGTDTNGDGIPDQWAISKGFLTTDRIHDVLNPQTGYTYAEDYANTVDITPTVEPITTFKKTPLHTLAIL